ncbi:BAG family molecular chaperone regulator 8, chloroplastic isoform X2 [Brassica rapa]|uniref:BAG family molecular chaperone regulator 8, chloroplastic isoform X2 n=1 Tax=Brassica campestris TaxID=3711 RepID=UPI00142D67BD|nr:BAG family molecular chaperone regulator 8, chloroplastic isoform X2 [Brassica rapa]
MASRHHHACSQSHNHHNQIPLVPTSPHCCTHSNHPSPPPPDTLLHLLASYLQTHQQETHFPNQTCSCNQNNVPRQQHDQVILSCLLRKIDALESSLNKFAPFHDQRRDRHSTVRDSAARVIQTHFRSYLVQRSISFRYLKELAVIKSSFLSLKSSVSGKPIFPYKVVSRKATDLLLQLDSIQGRVDPMIRSSKRSLSRDLVRFLQYVDDCVVRRYAADVSFVGSHSKRPQGFGVVEERRVEKLRNRMGKVFVTCDEGEELDSTTDDSEEVSIDKRKSGSSKFRTGANVVKPTVRKTMVLDKNRTVYQDESVDSSEEETLVVTRDNERKHHGLKTRKMVLVKEGGGKSRVVKTVRFDEDGNVYKVYGDTPEASSISEEGDDSTSGSNDGNGDKKGNEVEEIKYVPKEKEGFEEEEEETQSEKEVSSSEGSERDATGSNEHKKRQIQVQKGNLMVSPPLPLKMEP